MTTKPALVLVHGAWHGGWCWEPVIRHLGDVDVRTPELPSSGANPRRLGDMYDDARVIRRAVENIDGTAVVCAHSYAGIPVSDGLASVPNVAHLVYLCAYQLDVGERLLPEDRDSVPSWVQIHEQEGYVDVRGAQEALFSDCPPQVAAWASARLERQSLASWRQPVREAAWRGIPSTYVVCTRDAALPPFFQRRLAKRAGKTLQLASSHSPFLSQPEAVAKLLRAALHDASPENASRSVPGDR